MCTKSPSDWPTQKKLVSAHLTSLATMLLIPLTANQSLTSRIHPWMDYRDCQRTLQSPLITWMARLLILLIHSDDYYNINNNQHKYSSATSHAGFQLSIFPDCQLMTHIVYKTDSWISQTLNFPDGCYGFHFRNQPSIFHKITDPPVPICLSPNSHKLSCLKQHALIIS